MEMSWGFTPTQSTQTRKTRRMFQVPLSIRVTNPGQVVSAFISDLCGPTATAECLVAAEYLAKGYRLSDTILSRAIQLDCETDLASLRLFRSE